MGRSRLVQEGRLKRLQADAVFFVIMCLLFALAAFGPMLLVLAVFGAGP